MIHINDGRERIEFLAKLGFDLLTGEACGLGARVLCDVTESGRQLLAEVLGVASLVPADRWNCAPETIGSVMIPRELFTPLIVFGLFREPQIRAVYLTSDGVYGMTSDDEIRSIDHAEWLTVERRYHRSGTAAGGLRNVHEMSGRVA